MGFFSSPKCPYCGGKLTYQGGSIGVKPWKCKNCIRRNREAREREEELAEIRQRLKYLEEKNGNI